MGERLGNGVIHQLETGVAADKNLLALTAQNLGKERLRLGQTGHLAVVALLDAVRAEVLRTGDEREHRCDKVELIAAGLTARHIQLQSLRLHGLEVGVRVGEDHLFALFAVLLIFVDGGDILDGRAAAVVAHAVKAHDGKARALLLGQRRGDVLLHGAIARAVAVDDAEGRHTGAVRRKPPKQRPGQLRILEGIRTQKDVVFNAAALQQRGQHGRMSEGIHVVARAHGHAELFLKIALAVQKMSGEGLARGHVAVGLNPHAADDAPAALGHPGADLLEHGRAALLHPAVVLRAGGGEHEVLRLIHAIQRGLERRLDLLITLLPLPEPDGVDVGVADHVNHRGRILLVCFFTQRTRCRGICADAADRASKGGVPFMFFIFNYRN